MEFIGKSWGVWKSCSVTTLKLRLWLSSKLLLLYRGFLALLFPLPRWFYLKFGARLMFFTGLTLILGVILTFFLSAMPVRDSSISLIFSKSILFFTRLSIFFWTSSFNKAKSPLSSKHVISIFFKNFREKWCRGVGWGAYLRRFLVVQVSHCQKFRIKYRHFLFDSSLISRYFLLSEPWW